MNLQFMLEQTMVIERLCGVGLYCLALIIVCNGIIVSKPNSIKKWLIGYTVVLAIMGYFFVPAASTDLSRLTVFMNEWSSNSLSWLIEACSSSPTPAYLVYFWLIGKLNNDALLPAITAALYYSLLFSCYWDYAKRTQASNSSIAISIAYLMSIGIYVQVISGIRSCLAFAVVVRAIYTECMMGRKTVWNLPLYAFAFTLHPAAIALGLVRLVHLAFQKRNGKGGRIGSIILVVSLFCLLAMFGSSLVESMLETASTYLFGDGYSYIWEYIIHIIQMSFVVYSLFKYKRIKEKTDNGTRELWKFVSILSFVVLVSLPMDYSVFTRYASVAGMLAPMVTIALLNYLPHHEKEVYSRWTIAVTVAVLALACVRGDLSSYKFFKI